MKVLLLTILSFTTISLFCATPGSPQGGFIGFKAAPNTAATNEKEQPTVVNISVSVTPAQQKPTHSAF